MLISIIALLIGLIFETSINGQSFLDLGCLYKTQVQELNATYIIGSVIPAHVFKGDVFAEYQNGILRASAIIYAVEEINKNLHLLPGIKLGYDIRDSCKDEVVATHHLVDYLLDPTYFRKNISILVGVIGASTSEITATMSAVLLANGVPIVSYAATSSKLSNRNVYSNFLRTVLPDNIQVEAIFDLVEYYGWRYVSVFASDNDYGWQGMHELRTSAKKRNICLWVDHTFKENLDREGVLKIVQDIKQGSKIVILWTQPKDAQKILEESFKQHVENITWIATESWGASIEIKLLFRRYNVSLSNTLLTLYTENPTIRGFEELIYNDWQHDVINCKNPWYVHFLEEKGLPCPFQFSGIARILPSGGHAQVIASIYALAYGLHDYLNCSQTFCPPAPIEGIDYKQLYKSIVNTDFLVPTSDYRVKFDAKGEISRKIYFYKNLKIYDNEYVLNKIGHWQYQQAKNNSVVINDEVRWGESRVPEAVCSVDCQPGSFRINGSQSCCWTCAPCLGNSISRGVNQYACEQCQKTSLASANRTRCNELTEERLSFDSLAGILLAILSLCGCLFTVLVFVLFFMYWQTPVVKSSSREMSTIQLCAVFFLFLLPLLYYWTATPLICMLRTFAFGFLFTTVISFVVVKTYRLLRVFNGRFTKVSRFLRNHYQVMFSFVFVFFQTLGTMLWYINFPVETVVFISEDQGVFCTICDQHDIIIFWAVLLYIFLLALLSGYMAFRARKLPENFNEAQHISLAMFTVCVLWFSYLPLYVSLDPYQMQVAFLCINAASCYAMLFVLFARKVRILLCFPRLNSPEEYRKATIRGTTIRNYVQDRQLEDGTTKSLVRRVVVFDQPSKRPQSVRRQSMPCNETTKHVEKRALRKSHSYTSNMTLDRPISIAPLNFKQLNKEYKMKKSASTSFLASNVSASFIQLTRPNSCGIFRTGNISPLEKLSQMFSSSEEEESERLIDESTF